MIGLDRLLLLTGNWVGKNRLQDPASGVLDDSNTTLSVTSVLRRSICSTGLPLELSPFSP